METPGASTAPTFSVDQGRPTARVQMQTIIDRAREQGQPVRVRIPFTLFDLKGGTRNYQSIRDAVWNITLPDPHKVKVEQLEKFVEVLGKVFSAMAEVGPDAILHRIMMHPLNEYRSLGEVPEQIAVRGEEQEG